MLILRSIEQDVRQDVKRKSFHTTLYFNKWCDGVSSEMASAQLLRHFVVFARYF